MSERRKIEERLRKKEKEILGLEEKTKAARVYVQALCDVLRILDVEDNQDGTPSADAVLRSGSAVAQARDVILGRGEPVHIGELLEALGKEATRESRASLTSSLSAYVRRREIFARPAPNTFGLIELDHHAPTGGRRNDPPRNFGKIESDLQPGPGLQSTVTEDDEMPF